MTSILADEVARFDGLAARWWDRRGPMAPLHAMNPLRVGWVDRRVRAAWGGPVRLLDMGCGAGLAAEALARLGHDVLGVDAGAEVIGAARAHAEGLDARLTYRQVTAEALLAEGARFTAVTALEVIEHVADPQGFVTDLAGLLEPGGVLVLSTLNRTRRSYVTAKLGAGFSPTAEVTLLYQNLAHTAPSATDLSNYTSLITKGTFTPVSLAQFACDNALNTNNINLTGLAQSGLTYS